ncbi:Uncharacterised protein [Salmonella enterica subsp. enterica]|uniref:Uncharacterized protein n=1 Tax=Salmonella enterica I TaxID=59201 RepID=A0A447P9Q5_SALET|nr:Uncharacterised protein [Salmonella enterica subsp. enterica]
MYADIPAYPCLMALCLFDLWRLTRLRGISLWIKQVVKDFSHDGRGGNAVASAVFQNQGNSDLRVFIRCKSGIKHMIAQANGIIFAL